MRPDINDIAHNDEFIVPKKQQTIIKVVGVGGGGNNAINHMYHQNIEGVSFVVLNTDRQALNTSPVPNRLLIGPKTTCGLGAGNKPEVGRAAAEESRDDIAQLFNDDTKMAFITAGMGGGTGTGAAPVVARIAHEMGILTIGIVTIPFLFEGQKKIVKALDGANEMRKYVDALLIINNQRLISIYPDLDMDNAMGKADDTLSTAARSISELITAEGRINLDFQDVKTTLLDGGVAIISTGVAEGENRVTKAINDALNSPLLKNRDVYSSSRILFNVFYNPDAESPLKASELGEIEGFMANFTKDVDVITGTTHDKTLENSIKITILASGFDVQLSDEAPVQKATRSQQEPEQQTHVDTEAMLAQEYGAEVIAANAARRDEVQYIILTQDDIENDELIDLLERTPAFERKATQKTAIRDKSAAAKSATAAQTAAQPVKPVKPGSAQTINFGE